MPESNEGSRGRKAFKAAALVAGLAGGAAAVDAIADRSAEQAAQAEAVQEAESLRVNLEQQLKTPGTEMQYYDGDLEVYDPSVLLSAPNLDAAKLDLAAYGIDGVQDQIVKVENVVQITGSDGNPYLGFMLDNKEAGVHQLVFAQVSDAFENGDHGISRAHETMEARGATGRFTVGTIEDPAKFPGEYGNNAPQVKTEDGEVTAIANGTVYTRSEIETLLDYKVGG